VKIYKENKASILKVFICEKLLASSWCSCSLVAAARKSSKTYKKGPTSAICNRNHNTHVLEHMSRKKSWLFTHEDPSVDKCHETFKRVDKCHETFKREFHLVIHRAKKKRYVGQMEAWVDIVA
jgi:hypothetical protein